MTHPWKYNQVQSWDSKAVLIVNLLPTLILAISLALVSVSSSHCLWQYSKREFRFSIACVTLILCTDTEFFWASTAVLLIKPMEPNLWPFTCLSQQKFPSTDYTNDQSHSSSNCINSADETVSTTPARRQMIPGLCPATESPGGQVSAPPVCDFRKWEHPMMLMIKHPSYKGQIGATS